MIQRVPEVTVTDGSMTRPLSSPLSGIGRSLDYACGCDPARAIGPRSSRESGTSHSNAVST